MASKDNTQGKSKIALTILKSEKVNINTHTSSKNDDNTRYFPSIYGNLSAFLNKTPDARILNCADKEEILVEAKSGETECVRWDSPAAKKAM